MSLQRAMEELRVGLGALGTVLLGDAKAVALVPSDKPDPATDLAIAAVLFVVLFLFNWGVRLLLVMPLLRRCVAMRRTMQIKFAQSIMEAIFYGTFAVVGYRVWSTQEWSWPSGRWWIGWTEGRHTEMRADLRCFYIMYGARYSQGILSVLLEPKRKDFVEMLVHHGVTILLVALSYVHAWNRVGSVVMVLMDPGDVPLHLAKMSLYLSKALRSKRFEFLANRLFEVFASVFFLTRLVAHGYVCWSCQVETRPFYEKDLVAWTGLALMYLLLLLQLYWFRLIVEVAMRPKGPIKDVRSDSSDADSNCKLTKHEQTEARLRTQRRGQGRRAGWQKFIVAPLGGDA